MTAPIHNQISLRARCCHCWKHSHELLDVFRAPSPHPAVHLGGPCFVRHGLRRSGPALHQRGLDAGGGGRRHRPRLRPGPQREEAGAAVLGRHLVPALQPAQGHAVQPPGLCRPGEELRGGACGRRPAGRAEAGWALQGARLPHRHPDDGRGRGNLPPAGRRRCTADHGCAAGWALGWAAPQGGAGRCPRRQSPQRQRVAHAGLPRLGGGRGSAGARQGAAHVAGRAGPAQRDGRCRRARWRDQHPPVAQGAGRQR